MWNQVQLPNLLALAVGGLACEIFWLSGIGIGAVLQQFCPLFAPQIRGLPITLQQNHEQENLNLKFLLVTRS